jgi:hypothetical protein
MIEYVSSSVTSQMWIPSLSEELHATLVKMQIIRNSFLRLFLNAWINQPRKTRAPPPSCNNILARAIAIILPDGLSNNQAILKEWLPITKK